MTAAATARLPRVAFCLDQAGSGGTEHQALRLARALARRGADVQLVIGHARGPLWEDFRASVGATHEYAPSLGDPLRALGTATRVARLLRSIRPDVVHAFDMYSNVLVAPVARLLGVPRVLCSKRWTVYDPPRWLPINRVAMRAAHLVVANGESVRRSLERDERVAPERTAVLPNALEEAAFVPATAEVIAPQVADRLAALRARGVVLWSMTARLVAVKQHHLAIEAVARLAREGAPVGLVLVGDGPLRSALESQAEELGIADRVVFCGERPPLPNPAFLGDGVLMTSSAEGTPNAITEGLAAGRAIVATDVGSAREIVERASAGEVVPSGDVMALAQVIGRMSADVERRRTAAASAIAYARSEHHIDTVCDRLLTLYATR